MPAREFHSETVLRIFEVLSLASVVVLYVFLRPKVTFADKKNLANSIPQGTLIVANHQSRLDPFFIVYHIGLRNLLINLPLYFPAASNYMRNIFLGGPMRLMGCFDIGATSLEKAKGLLRIKSLLSKKKTVLIFPEGRIVARSQNPHVFEKGISFLLEQNAPVLLVRIQGLDTWSLFSLKRHQTSIHFGELLDVSVVKEEKLSKIKEFFGVAHEL